MNGPEQQNVIDVLLWIWTEQNQKSPNLWGAGLAEAGRWR